MSRRLAPAKINLGLHVGAKREDGYHEIETVLLPITWYDTLSAAPADEITLETDQPDLPTDHRNLCMQAAELLVEAVQGSYGARLSLEKQIPMGAGLGGGSSDAAATLRLLSEYWALTVTEDLLLEIAAELGSDVPFFLHDGPFLATGRGTDLSPLPDSFDFPFAIVVAKPDVEIPTAEAYRQIEPRTQEEIPLLDLVTSLDLAQWREHLVNDFEPVVFNAYPQIKRLKHRLTDQGADYASLTGSGAAVFGIFSDRHAADRVRQRLEVESDLVVWAGHALV